MSTRRIGEACEVAQNSVPSGHGTGLTLGGAVTLMVRLDSERQKLSSAVQLPDEHWL